MFANSSTHQSLKGEMLKYLPLKKKPQQHTNVEVGQIYDTPYKCLLDRVYGNLTRSYCMTSTSLSDSLNSNMIRVADSTAGWPLVAVCSVPEKNGLVIQLNCVFASSGNHGVNAV
eukprot:UN31653